MFTNLTLKNFRNFNQASLDFSPKVNIFLGDNGQGKTNLLEALHIFSVGSSFRYAENENLIQHLSLESHLRAKIVIGEFDYKVKISISKSRKNIFIQDKKATTSDLIKKFPAVVFSPESLAAIKEGADQRRQLVDQFLVSFDAKNADLISDFKRCLKTRNRLLRDANLGEAQKKQAMQVLESLNPVFIKLGTDLCFQRIQALRAILPDLNNTMQNISRRSSVDISVEYLISGENAFDFDHQHIQFCLEKRLMELSSSELVSGISLVGPQKHDIRFLYDENDSRFYCSQGQQRALILSFKMAQIVYHRNTHGAYPVLLLDDVLSELDLVKREALISFLVGIDTQIFITTTDLNLPKDIGKEKCSVIHVIRGAIHDDRAHEELWRGLDSSP